MYAAVEIYLADASVVDGLLCKYANQNTDECGAISALREQLHDKVPSSDVRADGKRTLTARSEDQERGLRNAIEWGRDTGVLAESQAERYLDELSL